jgi:two-component system chemotaxis response regulator CheB
MVRKIITEALSRDPQIEVVGTAGDPYDARDKILEIHPDVLTLDVEMPRMDGITFLRVLQKHHPMPVIVISSITKTGSHAALEALEAGAVDVLAKPSSAYSIGSLADQLPERVKAAASVRAPMARSQSTPPAAPCVAPHSSFHPRQIVLLGASTGGTEALKSVLTQLPDDLPGICIVQHIPPYFSQAFADRLNSMCAFEVRQAVDGDIVKRGLALVAPGDYHMILEWRTDHYQVKLNQGPMLHHTRPAVDLLFSSGAECAGRHTVAAVLTGMGRDGALGMKKLQSAGAMTIAQNEETCVVFGMPRAAIELGAINQVVSLQQMPSAILKNLCGAGSKASQHTTFQVKPV